MAALVLVGFLIVSQWLVGYWLVRTIRKIPERHLEEATQLWRESFIREIREARLENRKLHKALLPSDERPN